VGGGEPWVVRGVRGWECGVVGGGGKDKRGGGGGGGEWRGVGAGREVGKMEEGGYGVVACVGQCRSKG